MQENKFTFKIGGRIIKTVMAVFLCQLIDSFRPDGAPFFATIAAVYCIQRNTKDTFEFGLNRGLGTIIGGIWGIGFLLFERNVIAITSIHLRAAITSLLLIPIIQFSVAIRHHKGVFITCLTFLSIVVGHGDDVSPFAYGIDRLIDTWIGIGSACLVSMIPMKETGVIKTEITSNIKNDK